MNFFKIFFASMLGTIITLILAVVIGIGIIGALVSSSDSETEITKSSLLHLTLDGVIAERSVEDPLAGFNFITNSSTGEIGLDDIVKNIRKAATDDNIKGIYLDLSSTQTGQASLTAIRAALVEFKKSNKKIIAYGEIMTQGAYFLASTADKVYINPVGVLEFRGFGGSSPFLKGLLSKLEVEPQIIRVGTFKSAVEPLILDKMSDANRLQTETYLGELYNFYISQIAISRNIPADTLKNIANTLRIRNAKDALACKLIDGVKYKDEVMAELRAITGEKSEKEGVALVSLSKYKDVKSSVKPSVAKDKIAVIYAVGDINGGEGDENSIGSEGLSAAIRKARLDDKVKAVVLRVNSPGGSALASDVIWREVLLCKKAKPVMVSMGDVAASGGYYIAAAADSIFAEANTITGSIGVFGILPNAQKFFNNKLGVTFDGVKTGQYADLGDISRPLTDAEKMILQNEVNQTYEIFTSRVAEGRRMPIAKVKEIAEGRVWSGVHAKDIGLVDAIGGLDRAISAAAKKAKITDYRVVNSPEIKSKLDKILSTMTEEKETKALKNALGESYKYYLQANKLLQMRGVQARMEMEIEIR